MFTTAEFARRLWHVRERSADAYWRYFSQPPGRQVSAQRKHLAEWLAKLPPDHQQMVKDLIRMCLHAGTFHTLTVLDGAASIMDTHEPTVRFALSVDVGNGKYELPLQDPEMLHDLYSANYPDGML
jgi:hypothetical protein